MGGLRVILDQRVAKPKARFANRNGGLRRNARTGFAEVGVRGGMC
jgi:hypothetical protein